MTEPNRNTAVTTIESSAARPAVPYVLPILLLLI